jgi:hypothetical protein
MRRIPTGIQYLSPWKARVRHMQKWIKMIRMQSATGGDHSKSSKPSYRPKSLPPNSIYGICTCACTPMYPLEWRSLVLFKPSDSCERAILVLFDCWSNFVLKSVTSFFAAHCSFSVVRNWL